MCSLLLFFPRALSCALEACPLSKPSLLFFVLVSAHSHLCCVLSIFVFTLLDGHLSLSLLVSLSLSRS
jgi:hypothetical protein